MGSVGCCATLGRQAARSPAAARVPIQFREIGFIASAPFGPKPLRKHAIQFPNRSVRGAHGTQGPQEEPLRPRYLNSVRRRGAGKSAAVPGNLFRFRVNSSGENYRLRLHRRPIFRSSNLVSPLLPCSLFARQLANERPPLERQQDRYPHRVQQRPQPALPVPPGAHRPHAVPQSQRQ